MWFTFDLGLKYKNKNQCNSLILTVRIIIFYYFSLLTSYIFMVIPKILNLNKNFQFDIVFFYKLRSWAIKQ